MPERACKIWAAFTVAAVTGLSFASRGLAPDEIEAAWSLLLYFIAGSCGVYGIWQLIRKKKQLRRLCAALATSVLAASIIGIVQAIMRYRLGDAADRIAGTLGNANYFATYLALAATTLVMLVRLELIKRWYASLTCVMAMIACGLTLSRTGIIAVLVGVGLALVVRGDKKLLSARIVAGTAAAILLGGVLLATYLIDYRRNVTNSDDPKREQLAVGIQAAEDLSRLEALGYSLKVTVEHPLSGVGFGTFAARNYDANGLYVVTHNTVMEVLAGTGLLGAVLMLSLLLSLVQPLSIGARRYLFPAAAAFGICCLFGDYLQSIEVFVIFAVLYLSVRSVMQAPPPSDQETQACAG